MNTDRLTQTRVTSDPFCPPANWRDQFAEACRSLRLSQQPLDPQRALLTGFRAQYKLLKALPRRQRRLIQRQWKQSLAGVALLFALGAQPALAATINVGGQCTLARAIVSANNDASPRGFCRPGRGADRIVLRRNSTHTLTRVNNINHGPSGLPTIRSDITIEGNGSTIRRAASAPPFRLIAVAEERTSPPTCPDCASLTLRNSTLSGGKATADAVSDYSAFGGALINRGGMVTLINSTISGNRADKDGGAVFNGDSAVAPAGGSLMLVNSTVSGNRASERGGGIGNFEYSSVRMTNSTVSGNTAGTDGGGVFNGYHSFVTVTNSTISGNTARDGGGVSTYGFGRFALTNSTITRNTASGMGGGINNFAYGDVTLANVLLAGNRAQAGAELHETLDDGFGTVTASDFNLFGHSGLTSAQAFVNFTPGGTDITATSDGDTPTALGAILNRSLASNGGATQTHALVTGSPAVDAINNGTCPPPATDQRGVSRPRDGNGDGGTACDIGSFEVAKAPTPVPSAKCQGVVATIVGTASDDYLVGTSEPDVIQGLAGSDRLVGLEGNDLICGGKDRDNIYGGLGNDRIYGELGNDRLLGIDGNDQIFGGAERDTIDGGVGTDRCDGGAPAAGDKAANCERVTNIP